MAHIPHYWLEQQALHFETQQKLLNLIIQHYYMKCKLSEDTDWCLLTSNRHSPSTTHLEKAALWVISLKSAAYENSFGTQETCYLYMLLSALVVTTLKKLPFTKCCPTITCSFEGHILGEHYDLHPRQWGHKDEWVSIQILQSNPNSRQSDTQELMSKAPSKLEYYLSGYYNQTMSCHLPTVFQQKSISADQEECPLYPGSLLSHFQLCLKLPPQE